jgi:hypothetical protein
MITSGRGRTPAEPGRDTERGIVAHALIRLAIGQRPQPGAKYVHAPDCFVVDQAAQPCAPLGWDHAGGVIGESRQHRDVMASLRPMMREFESSSGWRSHLGQKIL